MAGYHYHDQFASCFRDDPRFTSSQWESSLQSNAVCHWLGASLESALCFLQHPLASSGAATVGVIVQITPHYMNTMIAAMGRYAVWTVRSIDGTGTRFHYNDVIRGAIASQITSLTIVYSTVYSGGDQRKHQRSASLAFVWGIHRRPVNSPHKWPVTRKMFPFDDVIMH